MNIFNSSVSLMDDHTSILSGKREGTSCFGVLVRMCSSTASWSILFFMSTLSSFLSSLVVFFCYRGTRGRIQSNTKVGSA